jgi:hypothetical protein
MTELVIILPSEDSMSSCLFDKIHLLIISQTASLMGHLAQVFRLSGPTYGRPPLFLLSESSCHGTHGTKPHQFDFQHLHFPKIKKFKKK